MFLKKSKNKATGRIHLSIVKGYRDPNGKPRHKTIKSLGYLDVLEREYENPIAHFTKMAEEMTHAETDNQELIPRLPLNQKMEVGTDNFTNLGYLFYAKVMSNLGLDQALLSNNSIWESGPLMNKVFQYLLYTQLVFNLSSRDFPRYLNDRVNNNFYLYLDRFFENFSITKKEMVDGLSALKRKRKYIVNWLYDNLLNTCNNTQDVYCYNFPVTYINEGVTPVFVNLITNSDGFPLRYTLSTKNYFQGIDAKRTQKNASNKMNPHRQTLISKVPTLDEKYISDTLYDDKGYIFDVAIKSLSQEFKDFILDDIHYPFRQSSKGYFLKSRIFPRRINIVDPLSQKRSSIITNQRQVVYYSPELAKQVKLNAGLRANEEKHDIFDGYVVLITSELSMLPDEVVSAYTDFFNTVKYYRDGLTHNNLNNLSLSFETELEALLLSSFVSSVFLAYLHSLTKHKFTKVNIQESISLCDCSHITENYFLLHHYDAILQELGVKLGIKLDRKVMTKQEIKDISKLISQFEEYDI